MQMKDLVSSCRGGGEGTPGPGTVTASHGKRHTSATAMALGGARGAGPSQEDGGPGQVAKHRQPEATSATNRPSGGGQAGAAKWERGPRRQGRLSA